MGHVIHLLEPDREATSGGEASRRRLLGSAIRIARGRHTQVALASRLRLKQPTISGWESGSVSLGIEQIWQIETALGLPHGWIAVAAGFTDPSLEPLAVLLDASVRCQHQAPVAEDHPSGNRRLYSLSHP